MMKGRVGTDGEPVGLALIEGYNMEVLDIEILFSDWTHVLGTVPKHQASLLSGS